MALVRLLSLLAGARVGVATTFWAAGDPGNPNPFLACDRRPLKDHELLVAHPTLPCRSRVLLYAPRTGRWVVARVGDRGPRHTMVDLTVGTARAIRANGFEGVLMVPLDH